MAPHVEEIITGSIEGILSTIPISTSSREVLETKHRRGERSAEATKAHELVAIDPNRFQEVDDELGPACDEHTVEQVPAELSYTEPNLFQGIQERLFHIRHR